MSFVVERTLSGLIFYLLRVVGVVGGFEARVLPGEKDNRFGSERLPSRWLGIAPHYPHSPGRCWIGFGDVHRPFHQFRCRLAFPNEGAGPPDYGYTLPWTEWSDGLAG